MNATEHVTRSAPKGAQISYKAPVGVISFLNRTGPTLLEADGEITRVRRERFTVRGKDYVFVSFGGDPDWEIYRIDFDGSELFEGYASDALPAILKGEKWKPL